jgi:hypothetical protein
MELGPDDDMPRFLLAHATVQPDTRLQDVSRDDLFVVRHHAHFLKSTCELLLCTFGRIGPRLAGMIYHGSAGRCE